jgi:dTDP-4-dehydrorhamnose reductase
LKILLIGTNDQVGYELRRSLQGLGEIIAPNRSRMDLGNLDRVREVVREVKPELIVNSAGYTAVGQAEKEPELAVHVNGHAPGVLAEEAKKLGASLIHYSTDYVFDGAKITPYTEDDATVPANVYGRTKLVSEQAVETSGAAHLILRTGWVYGMRGKNFLLTVLRLARGRNELCVVNDQYGNPTWSRSIAAVTTHIVSKARAASDWLRWWHEYGGCYHLTARGTITWRGFAEVILDNAGLERRPAVRAITTAEYPLPAARPLYSVLDCSRLARFSCSVPHWKDALVLCQQE